MDATKCLAYNGPMKICAAQMAPTRGQLLDNLIKHKNFAELAAANGADFIFFPELSLTGYEPALATELAMSPDDERLAELQSLCDDKKITVAVGLPIRNAQGILIGMEILHPSQPRQLYCKRQLHADELPYFVSGNVDIELTFENLKLSPAICYESLQWEHSDHAARKGANIYFASVAKSANGLGKAERHFREVAKKFGMTVLMANCLGPSDNFIGAGHTSAWDREGNIVAQLNGTQEGLLIYDTSTQAALELYI